MVHWTVCLLFPLSKSALHRLSGADYGVSSSLSEPESMWILRQLLFFGCAQPNVIRKTESILYAIKRLTCEKSYNTDLGHMANQVYTMYIPCIYHEHTS